jgi:APA family basic amino acid/polyamine antiporter
MSTAELPRTIGLPTATLFIVGYVIGATIYILPGSLASMTGPAVFVAFLLAAVPALVACFVMAHIGSAFPVSGANFVLLRDVLSPRAGFMYLWIMISMAAIVIPMIALGFADYFGHYLPAMDNRLVACGVIVLFILFNCLGVSVATFAQNLMSVAILAALVIFGVGGVVSGDMGLMQPLFPKGLTPLPIAAITAYMSYSGVFVIAEIAGEIKNPHRNIPLAIALSFVSITVVYTLVALALPMIIPWGKLGQTEMAVVTASQVFLPKPLVTFIAVSALLAGATSVNGILLGLSRDFFQGARDGLFPELFSHLNTKTLVPVEAIILVGALALSGAIIGGSVIEYAQLALMGLMLVQIMTGVAIMRLPKDRPEVFRKAGFRLNGPSLMVVGVLYIVLSAGFLILLATEHFEFLIAELIYVATGLFYYLYRCRSPRTPNSVF